jgi:superfamily II DNA/RNA helicase
MGLSAVAMHGGRSQSQRQKALQAFSSGRAQALIATDVAARGIHIDAVSTVIHFDPPADHKDYLHRSGRTARAGASGSVVSMVTGDQQRGVRRMQRDLGLGGPIEAPRLSALGEGAKSSGDSVTARSRRDEASTRPPARHEKVSPAPGKGGQSLYVANLPWTATDDDLEKLFGRYGVVHETTIITDRRSGRSKGFGFVDMPKSAADSAVAALHGSQLGGRDITVRLARPSRYDG